jgi:hypothetical protein
MIGSIRFDFRGDSASEIGRVRNPSVKSSSLDFHDAGPA